MPSSKQAKNPIIVKVLLILCLAIVWVLQVRECARLECKNIINNLLLGYTTTCILAFVPRLKLLQIPLSFVVTTALLISGKAAVYPVILLILSCLAVLV